MSSLFVTGASGLIGRRLLPRLEAAGYDAVFCLARSPRSVSTLAGLPGRVKLVHGDLLDGQAYAPFLASCDTVLHLAAATGKATPATYAAVNVRGTQALVEACRQAGVRNFLHVSSIAAKHGAAPRHYYAHSKLESEAVVRASGLRYTIVRPTIVLAPDSRIWAVLLALGRLPVPIVFGDGSARIQPIHVDDLVDCLLVILSEGRFANATLELGGPDQVRFKDFIQRIHARATGRARGVLCVPTAPLVTLLSIVEPYLLRFLPVTVGQLASFTEDGAIAANDVHERLAPRMKTVDEAIDLMLGRESLPHAVQHAR